MSVVDRAAEHIVQESLESGALAAAREKLDPGILPPEVDAALNEVEAELSKVVAKAPEAAPREVAEPSSQPPRPAAAAPAQENPGSESAGITELADVSEISEAPAKRAVPEAAPAV